MGQVGERPQWLFAALPSTRSVAESFHIGSDWGAVDGQTGTYAPGLATRTKPRCSGRYALGEPIRSVGTLSRPPGNHLVFLVR